VHGWRDDGTHQKPTPEETYDLGQPGHDEHLVRRYPAPVGDHRDDDAGFHDRQSRSAPAPRFAPLRARARGGQGRPAPRLEGGLTYRPGAWIGRERSLSDTAIRKRAKANGWTRDLPGAVRSRVREGVRANLLAGGTLRRCHRRCGGAGSRWCAGPAVRAPRAREVKACPTSRRRSDTVRRCGAFGGSLFSKER
jgi:hypothetical protein